MGCSTLCQLHKCTVGLEINEKVKENVESYQKTKLCFIRQTLAFGKMDEREKGINKHQKTLIDWWRQDIKIT